MRALFALAIFLACATAFAQMTRSQAEGYMSGFNALPPYSNAVCLWSLTAPDTSLVSEILRAKGDKAHAATNEAHRRKRAILYNAIIRALPKSDARVGIAMIFTLTKNLTSTNMRAVESATSHPVREVRWEAAIKSARWGYRSARIVLVDAVEHDQIMAVYPLSQVGEQRDADALRHLLKRVQVSKSLHDDPSLPIIAAMARLRDAWALKEMRKTAVGDSDPHRRTVAIFALGQARLETDFNLFLSLLKDKAVQVRNAAVEALARSGSKRAVLALKAMAADSKAGGGNGGRNGREYAQHVAECLSKGTKAPTLYEWNTRLKRKFAAAHEHL